MLFCALFWHQMALGLGESVKSLSVSFLCKSKDLDKLRSSAAIDPLLLLLQKKRDSQKDLLLLRSFMLVKTDSSFRFLYQTMVLPLFWIAFDAEDEL